MIRQCAILFGCLALGELIIYLTHIPLPSSILGMLLLTFFLKAGWIKLQWVQGLSDFLVANIGFFFVPPGVALMLYFDIIEAQFWPIVCASVVSTVLVLAITGWIHQTLTRGKKGPETNEEQLNKRTGWVLLNPILLTIAALIAFLKLTGVSYDTYNQGGHLIEFWLRPAVVALGVPLYLQLETIKKQFLPILISELAGCVTGIVSVVLIARSMGASRDVILSLAPKSVTTPIAMEVTRAVGGLPSLTAAVVVCVGLLGAVVGYKTMHVAHVHGSMAQGLSMGTAAHAVGTATSMDVSRLHGAYASLGLTLNGILTALLTPTILHLMGF